MGYKMTQHHPFHPLNCDIETLKPAYLSMYRLSKQGVLTLHREDGEFVINFIGENDIEYRAKHLQLCECLMQIERKMANE